MGVNEWGFSSVYLDTNVFIYALEGYPEYTSLLTELFQAIDSGAVSACTSELTIAEALVKPMLDKNSELTTSYLDFLQDAAHFSLLPVERSILIAAAKLRAESGSQVKLPDAVHLSSALSFHCDAFLTNDKWLRTVNSLKVVLLADMI